MRQITKYELPESIQNQINLKIESGKTYKDLSKKQKRSIRRKLLESQKGLCCYCEGSISSQNPQTLFKYSHNEHFFEQDDIKIHGIHSLDYKNNIIASCGGDKDATNSKESSEKREKRIENITCGHKKGKPYHSNRIIDYNLLLNPHDDIVHLFSYEQGYISASNKCNELEKKQVDYTIHRLSLDAEKLNRRRRDAIEIVRIELEDFSSKEKLIQFFTEYLNETKETLKPFISTLRQNFNHIYSI